MQELIDELEYKKNQFIQTNVNTESTDVYGTLKLGRELIIEAIKPFYDKIFNEFIVIVQDKLPKEKEQIKMDYVNGKYYHQYDDITSEDYYNKTYNQNK